MESILVELECDYCCNVELRPDWETGFICQQCVAEIEAEMWPQRCAERCAGCHHLLDHDGDLCDKCEDKADGTEYYHIIPRMIPSQRTTGEQFGQRQSY